MKRAVMFAVLAASLAVAQPPEDAWAQPTKPVLIGMLGNEDNPPWDGLRQGLRERGYVDGRNARFEWRWSGGDPDRLPALARELVALRPDVIVTSGSQASLAAAAATRTIPIVMAISQHPQELGLVKSLARPGGNLTGLTTYSPQLTAKRLELLRELVPKTTAVAVLWSPDSQSQRIQFEDLRRLAAMQRLAVQSLELRDPEDLDVALAAARAGAAQALLVVGNPITFRGRQRIADFTLQQRIPTVFEEQLFVEAGGLFSYGPNFRDLFHRAAEYVDKILRGARPASLPVEQPLRFELVINRKTARALGLEVPAAMALRADRIIE